MSVIHDLRCTQCEAVEIGVWVEDGRFPACEACGGIRDWIPFVFATDVYTSEQYSDATGQMHTSQRDKDRTMWEAGIAKNGVPFVPSGDYVHGGRPEHSIKDTAFSYRGQLQRISTGERARQRTTR